MTSTEDAALASMMEIERKALFYDTLWHLLAFAFVAEGFTIALYALGVLA